MSALQISTGLFLIIYLSKVLVIGAQCIHQYKVVRANGQTASCALDSPAATHGGDSLSACSSRCSADDNCRYYNYGTPLNLQPVCQLYNGPPVNTAAESHCLLFAVR